MKSRYKTRNPLLMWFYVMLITIAIHSNFFAQVSIEMTSGITIEIQDVIRIDVMGDWLNNGSMIPGSSLLLLNGSGDQVIKQAGGGFYNVTIDKSAGEVSLESNIAFQGGILSLLQQDLSLNGHIITLDPFASLSETPGNTVKGNEGYITTTRNVVVPAGNNIAGMGLMIASNGNYRSTEIRRGHAAQIANGAESILRYFEVNPEFNEGFESSIVFLYDESELNGNLESGLTLFHSPDGGMNWINVPGILNTTTNSFEATGINPEGRFTLSSHCLETCIATQALTTSIDLYLNGSGLAYLLPEDVDNNSKGACGIDTMFVFPEVFDCSHAGVQEVLFTVIDNNGCSKTSATTITVFDTIAPEVLCRNITLTLNETCEGSITYFDVDNGTSDACGLDLNINITSFDCTDIGPNEVTLTATDLHGNVSQCTAIVTVEMELPEVECRDHTLNIGNLSSITLDPFDFITGNPEDYEEFTFEVNPDVLHCDDLGYNEVTLTITDPLGEITTCIVTVHLTGPDADCDDVADQCDACDGGNDQLDMDGDNIPDCADWDGWSNLNEEWQCAVNKVFVCHEGNVICVSQNAVQAHLDHGDFLGSCNASYCENIPAVMENETPPPSTDAGENPGDNQIQWTANEKDPYENIFAENFPNPFTSETNIRFYLPENNWLTITVFNTMGQPVEQLIHGFYHSGWHETTFDATNNSNGLYFYELKTSHQRVTKTMILVGN